MEDKIKLKLFDCIKRFNPEVLNVYRENVQKFILNNYKIFLGRDLVIWGGGLYGRTIARLLIKNGFKVKGFCWSNSIDGEIDVGEKKYRICNYKVAHKKFQHAIFLIMSDYVDEIVPLAAEDQIDWFFSKEMQYIEKQYIYMNGYPDLDYLVGVKPDWLISYQECIKKNEMVNNVKELISILDDDTSKEIVINRLITLFTGELSYNESIPLTYPQYFSKDYYLSNIDKECYVDVGAFVGDSVLAFMSACPNYRTIKAYEPDPVNYKKLKELKENKSIRKLDISNAAVADHNGLANFRINGNMGSHVVNNDISKKQVKIVRLDDDIEDPVTFIKMDIEGGELSALQGAEELIKKNKPKLAICLYHKPFDIFEIPFYLRQIVNKYHFSIRQHKRAFPDLVLYASV